MRVAVIGAGLAGVATAHELALRGQDVVVLDSRPAIASEASFATAGLLAPGLLMLGLVPGLGLRPAPALTQAAWLWRHWRARRGQARAGREAAMVLLAQLGQAGVHDSTDRLRLDVQQASGLTVLLRSEREARAAQRGLARLAAAGVAHEALAPDTLHGRLPALNPAAALHGAIHLPHDGVGNARHYAQLLKDEAQRLGVDFRLGQAVQAIAPAAGGGWQVATADGAAPLAVEAVVACTGAQAQPLLQPLGLKLALARAHVHSITAPLSTRDSEWADSPRGALFDSATGTVISRLGPRLRVSGATEFGGTPGQVREGALRSLYRVLEHWLPGVAQSARAQHWKGARPLLPDGAPLIGAGGPPGLWLNLGHDLHGWPLACGAAVAVAEQVCGRPAPLDLTALSAQRLA